MFQTNICCFTFYIFILKSPQKLICSDCRLLMCFLPQLSICRVRSICVYLLWWRPKTWSLNGVWYESVKLTSVEFWMTAILRWVVEDILNFYWEVLVGVTLFFSNALKSLWTGFQLCFVFSTLCFYVNSKRKFICVSLLGKRFVLTCWIVA